MIAIRGNFFYTRTVPCELWFFDRSKPKDRKDKVLMIDARNVYRKVTRRIYDFSPEQMQNLSAVVWLYRGQQKRFLGLVKDYLGHVCAKCAALPAALEKFDATFADLTARFNAVTTVASELCRLDAGTKQALGDAAKELTEARALYDCDAKKLLVDLHAFQKKYARALPETNDRQHTARKVFDPLAEAARSLVKQIDLLYKLATRVSEICAELSADESLSQTYDRRVAARTLKQLDEGRRAAVEQLKQTGYFHRQVTWLQNHFPDVQLQAVPGLVKLISREQIKAADWSITPGRYVGVAPLEEDDDFDFEQILSDIHTELADLNKEAAELAAKIQQNFAELGA